MSADRQMNHPMNLGYATQTQAQNAYVQKDEVQRAIPQSMTELAEVCGQLETVVRELAARISVALPGGSPFDLPTATTQPNGPGIPVPCHSALTDHIDTRVRQLRELSQNIRNMAERIEL